MLSLLKRLFGGKPADVAAEVPYKVEAPVLDLADIAIAQRPDSAAPTPITVIVEAPVVAVVKTQPKKRPAKRKPAGPKTAQKPAAPKKKPKLQS